MWCRGRVTQKYTGTKPQAGYTILRPSASGVGAAGMRANVTCAVLCCSREIRDARVFLLCLYDSQEPIVRNSWRCGPKETRVFRAAKHELKEWRFGFRTSALCCINSAGAFRMRKERHCLIKRQKPVLAELVKRPMSLTAY
jgi:hypothetical protein